MGMLIKFLIIAIVSTSITYGAEPAVVKLDELKAATHRVRDQDGIAHIIATNEHDVFFLQGYVHAQDRLFQMDVSRRRANGRLAELLGPQALQSDVMLRTIGLHRAAERSLEVYSQRALQAMAAYAAGVNAFVTHHPLPPEYTALELTQFEPWTVLDSVTVAKLIAFSLSFDLEDIDRTIALLSYQGAGAALGFNGTALFFEDLFRSAPFDPASTLADASVITGLVKTEATARPSNAGSVPIHLRPQTVKMSKDYRQKVRKIPFLKDLLDRDDRPGSNEWALSGALTENGIPLLANDPHLALSMPSTFYPIHLSAGSLDVLGSGFPGLPTVIVGHNRFISWGATVNPMDVTDVYQEQLVADENSPSGLSTVYLDQLEPVIPIPETYRSNVIGDTILDNVTVIPPSEQIPAVTLIVPRRNQGPIIEMDAETGLGLSLQYTGFSATREVDTFLIWDSAQNINEFIRGFDFFDFGSENFAYADVRGNIAYFTGGEMPVREDLQASTVAGLPPFFIRNGRGGNEWLPVQNPQPGQAIPFEILPFDEMPQIINPPMGWFVNSNNDPAGTTLDNDPLNQLRPGGGIYYLSSQYEGGYRAGRLTELIRERIENNALITFEDLQAWQADTVLRDAQVFVPYIMQALTNAQQPDANPLLAAFTGDPAVLEAVGRLSTWDFTTPTGIYEGYDAFDIDGMLTEPGEDEITASVAATLYSVWRGQFVRNVIDRLLAPFDLPGPGDQQTLAAIRNLLDNFDQNQGFGASGVNFFNLPDVASAEDRRDIIILQSLAAGLERLAGEAFAPAFAFSTDQVDYRWGKLHRIVFQHPLGEPFSIPAAAGAFPAPLEGLLGIPTDGGFQTPDASHHDIRAQNVDEFMFTNGPVNRFAAELGVKGTVRAESIWPGGTSGVLGSPLYVNMLPRWLTNDTIPLAFGAREIRDVTDTVTVFVPKRNPGHRRHF